MDQRLAGYAVGPGGVDDAPGGILPAPSRALLGLIIPRLDAQPFRQRCDRPNAARHD
jgi:hypothetical protein